MEIGIDSFAAAFTDASVAVSAADRIRELVEQIEFANRVGLDVFGIGEHHRREFLEKPYRSSSCRRSITHVPHSPDERRRGPGRGRPCAAFRGVRDARFGVNRDQFNSNMYAVQR
jgi:hypothetical protein